MKRGIPHFATRRNGKLAVVAADSAASQEFEIQVSLEKNGRVTLTVDGQPAASQQTAGPLTAMPQDGLQVGADRKGAVGDYEAPFELDGQIKVSLELTPQ